MTGQDATKGIIKLAVLAVGGQGGGVLANWIADLATAGGYAVQMTSVAGVAQRTGATIYHVEMAPKADAAPVFALAPAPGDVDIVIASELMEAGRAVMRGFVTPDRTTLVASTHRILAVSEKQVPGDGRGDGDAVAERVRAAARHAVMFDMERIAQEAGSVISASLFGGLARSGALPFAPDLYEQVIRASGRGVDPSLAAFRGALAYTEAAPQPRPGTAMTVTGPDNLRREWETLTARIETLPEPARDMARAGLRNVVDYQDIAYGRDYLDRLARFAAVDDENATLTTAAAKYIANAMCYDDIIRVADLKTRASRATRLRGEQQVPDGSIVQVTEYFHPRAEELVSILPARLSAWVEERGWAMRLLGAMGGGKRLRSDRIGGFLMLWLLAGLRRHRRALARHATETAHLDRLESTAFAARSPALGAEILACQRLIKGYSDTHARGLSKFDRVMAALPMLDGRDDAADWVRRLREAALQDEKGAALDGAIATIRSFTGDEGRAA